MTIGWRHLALLTTIGPMAACGGNEKRTSTSASDAGGQDAESAKDTGTREARARGPSQDSGLLPDNVEPQRIALLPRPSWNPDIALGTEGWRQSTTPFCSEDVASLSSTVWVTANAVYVATSSVCNRLGNDICNWNPDQGGLGAVTVYKNTGNGWNRIYRHANNTGTHPSVRMEQYADGRLVLVLADECPVRLVADDGTATCIWNGSTTFVPFSVAAVSGTVFVTGTDMADPTSAELWRYDGGNWARTKTWANRVAGATGLQLINGFLLGEDDVGLLWVGNPAQPDSLTSVAGAPASSVPKWTYGASDILSVNSVGGLAHFGGGQWTLTASGFSGNVTEMWGAPDKTVFLKAFTSSGAGFGRFVTDTSTPIFQSTELVDASIWGLSSTEVFLTVSDLHFRSYDCGTVFLLWYDGSAFHPF